MTLTWTCHICARERPDEKISVHKKEALVNEELVTPVVQNIRYCNDDVSCLDGAVNSPPLDLRTEKT